MITQRHPSRGFTLTELLVATAIMTGVFGITLGAIRVSQQSQMATQSNLAVSSELRRGLAAMSRELAGTQTSQVSIAANDTWYASLAFRVPQDIDGDGTVVNAATGALEWSSQITYLLVGTQILRRQAGTIDRVMANGVTPLAGVPGLQFRRPSANPRVVNIRLTVQRATGTGEFHEPPIPMGTDVTLRN